MAISSEGSAKMGGNINVMIKRYIQEVRTAERMIDEAAHKHVAPLKQHLKDVFSAASAEGLDKKCLKEAMRRIKMDEATRFEMDAYELAWFEGMVADEKEEETDI